MESPTRYLRSSDLHQEIYKNYSVWEDDYAPVGIVMVAGAATCGIASFALNVMGYACFSGYSNYCIEQTTHTIVQLASGTLGATGTVIYTIFKRCQIQSNRQEARNLIQNESEIISNAKYVKFLNIMGTTVSKDLDKQYLIPNDSEIDTLIKNEQTILNTMLENILKPSLNKCSTYKDALNKLNVEQPISDFLKGKLNIENFEAIFDFAKQNKLESLQYFCEKYFKEHQIEIFLFSKKNI